MMVVCVCEDTWVMFYSLCPEISSFLELIQVILRLTKLTEKSINIYYTELV
jgi:hypothetical protein